MKRKEIVQLLVAVVILVIAGYVIYLNFGPKGDSKNQLTYEKITPINPNFDDQALQQLTDINVKDFYAPPDLKSGIGNPQPFTPIK